MLSEYYSTNVFNGYWQYSIDQEAYQSLVQSDAVFTQDGALCSSCAQACLYEETCFGFTFQFHLSNSPQASGEREGYCDYFLVDFQYLLVAGSQSGSDSMLYVISKD